MELTRKQIILIAIISGAILLLTMAAVLISAPADGDAPPEPSSSPAATASPSAAPTATASPEPTVFRLPLVPAWDTPQPTRETEGTVNAFVPHVTAAPGTEPPGEGAGPQAEAGDEQARDILAVGLQDGRTAALLMLRISDDTLTVTALPADAPGPTGRPLEETFLAGDDLAARAAQAASLAEGATGRSWGDWMALDLGCLPAVLEITGPLGDGLAAVLAGDGTERARGALSLMAGTVTYLEQVSLLKLPALRRAVGDAFASSLNTRELWSLLWTVRRGVTVRGSLRSAENAEGSV